MANLGGWVKLHRSTMEHPVFADPGVFKLWTHLLFNANWEPKSWVVPGTLNKIEIGRGQLIVGCHSLHEAIFPRFDSVGRKTKRDKNSTATARTVWRWLKAIESYGCIKVENVSNRCSIVTICNYSTYQDGNSEHVQPVSNQCLTGVLPASNQCLTDVQPVSTTKELKKERSKEVKKKEETAAPPFSTADFIEAWASFEEHRRVDLKKPVKPTQAKKLFAMLAKMGHDRAVAALDHTVAMGWQGIREPDSRQVGPSEKPVARPATREELKRYVVGKGLAE